MNTDARRHAPWTQRNREPLARVLATILPESGGVLELASGSGEHICHFAKRFPGLLFQPSDPDPNARRSIEAWIEHERLENVRPPLALDAQESERWPCERLCEPPLVCMLDINMIHISPWSACEGLMLGAECVLPPASALLLYGPYKRGGRHTAQSNAAFDSDLRTRDPSWGVRDLDDVVRCAEQRGLCPDRVVEMPANNLSLIFRREPSA